MASLSPNKQRALEKENVPKNYNGIANMKADKLKKLGKIFNIDPKLPKKARIVLLCQVLGISTTGTHQSVVCRTSELLSASQKEELFKLTAAYMCQLTNWSKDLASVPDIEVSSVKKYLVKSEVLRASDARTYKLSRPYALMNFVHSVLYCEHPGTFSVVRALCNASQSASSDEVKVVYVIIDQDFGEPYGGFCTCTVGNSERCGHIGAVLFKLTDLQSTGTTEGPSCTDTLCGWSDPKGCQAEPTVFSDLAIKKTANDTLRRTVEDYGAKVTHQAAPTYDQVTDLRAKLISATHHTGQYCPAIHVLNADRFREAKETVPVRTFTELPSTVALYDECLAHSKEETVHTTPATIPQLVGEKFYSSESAGFKEAGEKLFRAATSMNIDRNEVGIMTCGQSQNQEWHDQRQGAITATKFHRVMRVKEKYSDTLAKELVAKSSVENKKLQNVPAIKWGRRNESNARKAYFNKCAPFHKDFIVEEHGLMVYRHYNFIRGSPDGIVSCRCHGHTLLEIKCPFSARTMSVQEGVEKGIIKYLETVDGHLKLKENSAEGYYAQIQGLLGITGIQTCHLVVWTKKGFVTVTVRNDHKFFHTKIVPACTSFFKNYVVPKLLLKDEQNDEVSVSAVETKVAISSVETEVLVSTVETEKTENVRPTDIQPSKRKRVVKKKTGKSVVLPKSPPSKYSSAKGILSELQQVTGIYQCRKCKKILPDDNVAEDNSNASVGCDCPNCGGCDTWMCWPCAQYDQEWADAGYDWHCPECTRECDIVY